MTPYIVVSFSGGKDSTAMLLRMIELGEHIDEVVCCDTYKEFPAMYRHIEKIKTVVEAAGIKFTMLKGHKSFDWWMFEYVPEKDTSKIKRMGFKGFSWPGSRMRWCTNYLKGRVITAYFAALNEQHDVIKYVGIAADEMYRMETQSSKGNGLLYPLIEWGWTEADCLKYCYDHGYDWEGLYEIFRNEKTGRSRVSCWCCPLQSLEALRKLRKHFPDLWEQLKDMDKRTYRTFKENCSVEDLEIRFQLEAEWEAQGLIPNARTKAFREALKERMNSCKREVVPE